MIKEHPLFELPDDGEPLWRYLTFDKFMAMMESKSVSFPRADKLGDPFEGSLSRANVDTPPSQYKDQVSYEALRKFALFIREYRRYTAISCWHWSQHESEAMWKLYSASSGGIAIKTSVSALRDAFSGNNEEIFFGSVRYVDYESSDVEWGDNLAPFIHKRLSFKHEQEVRAIIQEMPVGESIPPHDVPADFDEGHVVDLSKERWNDGADCPVELSALIDEVVIGPTGPGWFLEMVGEVVKRYIPDVPVRMSDLAASATWGAMKDARPTVPDLNAVILRNSSTGVQRVWFRNPN